MCSWCDGERKRTERTDMQMAMTSFNEERSEWGTSGPQEEVFALEGSRMPQGGPQRNDKEY